MDNRNLSLASVGTNIAAGMLVFTALGIWIDRKWGGDQGWFTLAGIFLGLFYCGYEIWKIIRNNQ